MAISQNDLIAAIDQQNGRFRLDKVKVITPDGLYRGNGIIECRERLKVSVTLPKGTPPPASPRGIVSRENFWRFEGQIEGSLEIAVEKLAPFHELNSANGIHTLVFHLDEVDITPKPSDKLSKARILKMIMAKKAKDGVARSGEANQKQSKAMREHSATFFAVLKGHKLIAYNKGTDIVEENDFLGKKSRSKQDTYVEALPEWEYGLIQVGDDVHVHLRSEIRRKANNIIEDQKHFDAFLKALAFTHGWHAWPAQIQYRSDHKLLINRIKCIRRSSETPHSPFSERIWHNAVLGQLQWDLSDPIDKAYRFFLSNSEFSKEIDELLYLFREAGDDGVPLRVSLLTICTLYESLMRSVFHNVLTDRQLSSEVMAFNKLKTQMLKRLKKRSETSEHLKVAAISRMVGYLSSASDESIREIAVAVTGRLWANSPIDWKSVHKEWATYRNPLSHRIGGSQDKANNFEGELLAVSRLAGAINAIVLKVMGYSGTARISTFEDGYKQI